MIFYSLPGNSAFLSVDRQPSVVLGQGTLNWTGLSPSNIIVNDDRIGTAITEPLYAIASAANTIVQVTEYMYEDDCDDLADLIKALTGSGA